MASLDELSTALINADKAGDVEGARLLASEISKMRAPATAPAESDPAQTSPYLTYRTGKRAPGGRETVLPTIDQVARMAANGATFGLADKFAGGMDYLTGQAPSYTEGVNAQRAQTEAVRKEHPVGAVASEVAGGLGTGAGLVKSGVTLAGKLGAGLLPRVVGYGAEGAAYGAVHGAGNTFSDNPQDYINNAFSGAKVGGMIGAGLPVAGSVLGSAYRAGSAFLGPQVAGVGRGGSALLRGAAMADESGLRGLGAMGPDAMLPDAGPAMLGLAQGAGTGTGAGKSALVNALRTRDQETAQRLAGSLDRNLGPAPIPSQVEGEIAGNLETLAPRYGDSFQNARAVNTQPIADHLDTAAIDLRGPSQQAVRRVREFLDIPGSGRGGRTPVLDPAPEALFQTRQAIDGLLATETNPQVVRQLTIARQMVDAEVGRSVPGVKNVDAAWAELQRQREALTRGGQVLDSGKTAIRPAELAAEIQQGALPRGTQVGPSAAPVRLRQGVRADIDRRVGTNINDLVQLERTFGTPQDWNYQKLGTVFGPEARDRVAGDISANRQFRDTYQKVVQNSQTAQRTEAAKAMEGAAGGNIPQDLTATSLGLKAANAVAKLLSGQSNATTKDQIGQLLSSRGPQAQQIAQLLLDSARQTNAKANTIRGLVSSPQWLAASAPEYGRK